MKRCSDCHGPGSLQLNLGYNARSSKWLVRDVLSTDNIALAFVAEQSWQRVDQRRVASPPPGPKAISRTMCPAVSNEVLFVNDSLLKASLSIYDMIFGRVQVPPCVHRCGARRMRCDVLGDALHRSLARLSQAELQIRPRSQIPG